ncbi:MAG: glycosyltransferase family 2 protein [Lentisphaerae bacterium]|nr:glycosyltransferase family 2 protein [Lentisphaerota bacterium]
MVGIVIVAYKSPDLTVNFVRRELPKIDVPYCAIVVNNASTPEADRELAERCEATLWGAPRPHDAAGNPVFIAGFEDNLGYAVGNNRGAALLSSLFSVDAWLFTNNDIELQSPDLLSSLLAVMRARSDRAMIGPRVVGLTGNDQSPYHDRVSIWRQIAWRLLPFLRNTKQVYPLPQNNEGYCYWLVGAFVLVDADAFAAVGGFDDRTFLYNEEMILSERMARQGFKAYYYPKVSVLHYERASTKGTAVEQRRAKISQQSLKIYYRYYRHASWVSIFLLDLAEAVYRVLFSRRYPRAY